MERRNKSIASLTVSHSTRGRSYDSFLPVDLALLASKVAMPRRPGTR